jgi:YHS domain-containing protein
VFLGVFAVLVYLARNRQRFGGGAGLAVDPVCGMQVQVEHAPAQAREAGSSWYFCSDHCRERFESDPGRFVRSGGDGRTAEH